jgi:hypothetical protein
MKLKNGLLAALVLNFGWSMAAQAAPVVSSENLMSAMTQIALSDVHTLNLINWSVGDTAEYNMTMGFGFLKGTSKKYVDREDNGGTAIWIIQEIKVLGQNQKIEMLMNRADGKILKLIQNGQEAEIPTDKPEIISQDYQEITVPAGTFDCVHIVGKQTGRKFELWANPVDTVMDGGIKQVIDTGIAGNIEMVLTSFKKI